MFNTQLLKPPLTKPSDVVKDIIDLNLYNSTDLTEIAFLETLKYDHTYEKTVRNILLCCKRAMVKKCRVDGCEEHKKVLFMCHCKFCSIENDVTFRRARADERLRNANIKSNKLYHWTIGSNQLNKKGLEKDTSKLVRGLRKAGYTIAYIKAYDIGRRNYAETGLYFKHFHIALLPEKLDVREFTLKCRKILKAIKSKAVFNNIGWRNKKSLFNYFSKRVAGQYGHKGDYYFLKDIITLKEYLDTFWRSKVLTYSLPEGLTCKAVPSSSSDLCPIHEIPLIFSHFEAIVKSDYPPDPP